MLPNKNHHSTRNSERSTKQFDQLLERLASVKQLSIADQRISAINMGKLAALVNPKKPYDGAMQIISASKLSGVKDKRKRFFRLPGEDAPFPCEPGAYNANPSNFVSLAKAAGRLMSNSRDRFLQEKEEKRALLALLLGTSYVPSYMPETLAERSVKGLLEEYALRLAEAIGARTRITELWEALETTPIAVVSQDVEEQPSEYGTAAVWPPELLRPMFKRHVKSARFQPNSYPQHGDSWSEPVLELGYLMATYKLHALKIPKDKEHLFPPVTEDYWAEFEACASERNAWLEGIGFDVNEHRFRDGEIGRDQICLDKVTVGFLHEVSLGIRRGVANRIELEISTWPTSKHSILDEDFIVSSDSGAKGSLESSFESYVCNAGSASPVSIVPVNPVLLEGEDLDELVHNYPKIYALNCFMLEDVSIRSKGSKFLFFSGGLEEEYWADEDDFDEYWTLKRHNGWLEDAISAKILLGANNLSFIPNLEDAEPEAGAARAGSIAASILKNAMSASPENRISQLLIDRVALTAEAGLNFHNALLEKSRSAISQI